MGLTDEGTPLPPSLAVMINYDKAIANAAVCYVKAKRQFSLNRTENNGSLLRAMYTKLTWMIDAEIQGWNPSSYRPEDH